MSWLPKREQAAKLTQAGHKLASLIGDNLSTNSTKTTIELNLAVLKITHEVTRYYAAVSAEAKERLWKEALPSFNVTSTANAAALVAVTFKKGESGYMGTVAEAGW